jgi:hypothetical protein
MSSFRIEVFSHKVFLFENFESLEMSEGEGNPENFEKVIEEEVHNFENEFSGVQFEEENVYEQSENDLDVDVRGFEDDIEELTESDQDLEETKHSCEQNIVVNVGESKSSLSTIPPALNLTTTRLHDLPSTSTFQISSTTPLKIRSCSFLRFVFYS